MEALTVNVDISFDIPRHLLSSTVKGIEEQIKALTMEAVSSANFKVTERTLDNNDMITAIKVKTIMQTINKTSQNQAISPGNSNSVFPSIKTQYIARLKSTGLIKPGLYNTP